MPRELTDREQLDKVIATAEEVRLVKREDGVKLKVRTKNALYTFKTTEEDAQAILKGKKVDIIEY